MRTRLVTLPNLITLANLLCGTLGIVSMVSLQSAEALRTAFVLTMAAAVFDFLDGFAARLTGQYSAVGAQLDSLADMVSFAVLPTLVAMKVYYLTGGHGAWSAVLLLIALCGALRLARFNVSDDRGTEFRGLPVPACALLVGAAGWFASGRIGLPAAGWVQWFVLAAGAALALLMVSSVRMFSLKFAGFGWRGNEVRYVFLAVSLVIVAVAGVPGVGLAVVLYILYSLAVRAACRRRK
ncbi:MAG TPA: CDP-alcohol phosphatidyltransferase family protein [Candidatus Tidjanibacter gallistercoris]|nr:CDP-alcohol phosphatidyltransferase family protein [Candidatus Tidjanibacter gallistercoris]